MLVRTTKRVFNALRGRPEVHETVRLVTVTREVRTVVVLGETIELSKGMSDWDLALTVFQQVIFSTLVGRDAADTSARLGVDLRVVNYALYLYFDDWCLAEQAAQGGDNGRILIGGDALTVREVVKRHAAAMNRVRCEHHLVRGDECESPR